MTPAEIVGSTTGVITILGVIVGVIRHITQLQAKLSQEQLKVEKTDIERKFSDLDAKYKELVNEITTSARIGTTALNKKQEIEDELSSIMEYMRAQAASIYIPLSIRPSAKPSGLAFLSIQPFGQEAVSLKRKIIPLQSLAGRCFTSKQAFVCSNSKTDPNHFDKADKISGYRTQDTLNIPLRIQQECVGVLQLLNKEGKTPFNADDLQKVEPYADSLSQKVSEFVNVPDHLEILGVTPERETEYAVIMFCDLTNSAVLFQEMNASAAIQHINEYLEKLCEIAFTYKATVDIYTGDGVMFRFNVPRPISNPVMQAVKSALEMQAAFEKLKETWITMGELIGTIYNRIGITYGPVSRAMVGHPQYQHLTIFGQSVHVAANLCEIATRQKNIIMIDENIYKALPNKLITKNFAKEKLGKAKEFIGIAYELQGLHE